jgi:hypothetical protein
MTEIVTEIVTETEILLLKDQEPETHKDIAML